jgi:Xaa-Pro aminopeptidase
MRDTEKRFREILKNKIDYALIVSPENLFYISGYAAHQHTVSRNPEMATLLMDMKNDETSLIVMDYEFENARKKFEERKCKVLCYDTWVGVKKEQEVKENEFVVRAPKKNILQIVSEKIGENEKNLKIGIEKNFVSLNYFEKLKTLLPNAEFIDISDDLVYSRSVKTAEEIEIFRKLIKAQDEALFETMKNLKVGAKESDLAEIYRMEVMKNRGILPSGWSMFASGENCSILGLPSERALNEGDILKYDGGVTSDFNFYTTDFARSWIVGEKDEFLFNLKKTLFEAQRLMIENMKPGIEICEIFNIGFNYVKERYPQYERGHLGHSISLGPSTWEAPLITKSERRVLEPGMILCVEVPLYIEKLGGFNIEDMVLITESGAEILSSITPHFL